MSGYFNPRTGVHGRQSDPAMLVGCVVLVILVLAAIAAVAVVWWLHR